MDAAYKASIIRVLRSEGIVAVAHQFEVGRNLSKLGCLDSDEEMLRFIAPLVAKEDVVALHSYLKSLRSECEWRTQFESIFATHANALPKFTDYE